MTRCYLQSAMAACRGVSGILGFGLAVLLLIGMSCSTKPGPAQGRRAGADSTRVTARPRRTGTKPARAGAVAKGAAGAVALATGAKGKRGSLTQAPPTQDQKMAERKRQQDERKRLRDENRRKRQEERLARRAQRSRGSRSGGGRGSLYDAYTLKATIAGRYALVGGRRLERGDVIAGKKIIDIQSDRITLDQAGSTISVRIGELVDRSLTPGKP